MEPIAFFKLVSISTYLIYQSDNMEAQRIVSSISDDLCVHISITAGLIDFAHEQARGKYGNTATSQNL